MSQKYEGWTNRETWATNYHLVNNHDMYKMLTENLLAIRRELTREHAEDPKAFVVPLASAIRHRAADWLKDWLEIEASEAVDRGHVYTLQMLLAIGSLWRVNWDELATEYVRHLPEDPCP